MANENSDNYDFRVNTREQEGHQLQDKSQEEERMKNNDAELARISQETRDLETMYIRIETEIRERDAECARRDQEIRERDAERIRRDQKTSERDAECSRREQEVRQREYMLF